MAYCVLADLVQEGHLSNKSYTATSKPSTSDVQGYIDRYARRIDGKFRAVGITVPILLATSPIAYAIVKDINREMAAAKADMVMFKLSEPKRFQAAVDVMKELIEELNFYCNNPLGLSDAEGIDTSQGEFYSTTDDLWDVDDPDDIVEIENRWDTEDH